MNAFVIALVLFASTTVLGQNPYEYVDDALIQKVGQIVYNHDQQAASTGGAAAGKSVASGGYQVRQPERTARVNTFNNYNANRYVPQQQQRVNYVPQRQQDEAIVIPAYKSQQQYNQIKQQVYAQPQQYQYNNRNQRQLYTPVAQTYAPVTRTYQEPAARTTYQAPATRTTYQAPATRTTYQAPATRTTYQAPATRTYQGPQTYQNSAPAARVYQQPQVYQQPMQKSAFSAYTLSQPEVIPKVAEFHTSEALQARSNMGLYTNGNMGGYNNANTGAYKYGTNYANQMQTATNGFRLA